MKVRKDFVTNSSSSSFVIGKKDDTKVTIDSVFQTIKGFYLEYLSKVDELTKYVESHPELNLRRKVYNDGNHFAFEFIEGRRSNQTNWNIDRQLEKKFGLSTWDWFDVHIGWISCGTYQEYEKYWLEIMEKQKRIYAPFTIADFFETKKIAWLHTPLYVPYTDEKSDCYDLHEVDSNSDVLDWYYPWAKQAFKNMESCDKCDYSDWCDREDCEQRKSFLKGQKVPEDKACLYLLGRICIHSECGFIPDFVVEKLIQISEYSCNHMG